MNNNPPPHKRTNQNQLQSLPSVQLNNRHHPSQPQNHSLPDDEKTYPSPAPSPRPGLRLSLTLSHNKVDVTSHSPSTQLYYHQQLPYSSTTPRHSSSSSSSLSPFTSVPAPSFPSTSSSSSSTAATTVATTMNTSAPASSIGESSAQHNQRQAQLSSHSFTSAFSNDNSLEDMVAHSNLSSYHNGITGKSSLSRMPFYNPTQKSTKQTSRYSHGTLSISEPLQQKQRPLSTPSSSSFPSEIPNVSLLIASTSTPTPSDTIGLHAFGTLIPTNTTASPTLDAKSLVHIFQNMDQISQRALLTEIVNNCSISHLTHLNTIIAPKLKRDFLRDLPLELAHHILSFIDDPQSLARVGQVSQYWHQLVETEDWVWRAQCIKLFGPTSCSSLPSPKSHIAPPTSYLYTTSPTSLDAVSSTLKALSNSSSSSSSSSPTSHRLSLTSCSTSRTSSASSSKRTSPSWTNARELPVIALNSSTGSGAAASSASPSSSSSSSSSSTTSMTSLPSPAGSSNIATSTVLSSMLLANQGSLSPSGAHGPSAAASSFATLPTSSKLRSSMTSRLAAASAIASANAVPSLSSISSSTFTSSQGLGVASALSSLEGRATSSKRNSFISSGKIKATTESMYLDQEGLYNDQQLQHAVSSQLYKQTTSYKAYFKRRYMIDRNWISGDHSLISNITPETGVVTSLQFDHHHIVVGCDNSRIQIFETTTGRLLRTLQGHLGGVWALEFVKGVGATGEKILVTGGCDREVRVWDMNTGRCRQVMSGHTGTIRCLKLHQLPIGNNNNNNSNNNKMKGTLTGDDQNNNGIRNGTQGKQQQSHQSQQHIAITGSRDATLRVWDIQTGKNLFVLQGHRDSVRCIEVHGDMLVSGSYDCTARVWSLTTGECLLLLQGHFQQIYSIAFNGEYIITGSLDSTCRLWSPTTGACMATLQGHTQLVGQLQLSGDSLMTGGGDGFMYMWNLKSMVCQYRVQAHEQSVTSLCFDSKRIVTGGNDGAVKLWDRQTGKFIRNLTKTDAAIWRVAICEERVVMCMQKNGRTATEIMCFDSEAPVLSQDEHSGSIYSMGASAAAVMHDQQRLWESNGIRSFDELRI